MTTNRCTPCFLRVAGQARRGQRVVLDRLARMVFNQRHVLVGGRMKYKLRPKLLKDFLHRDSSSTFASTARCVRRVRAEPAPVPPGNLRLVLFDQQQSLRAIRRNCRHNSLPMLPPAPVTMDDTATEQAANAVGFQPHRLAPKQVLDLDLPN